MNNFDFTESRLFIQKMIENNLEKPEVLEKLLETYNVLIEKKSDTDIQYLKSDESLRKEWDKNDTERFKANTEYNKKLIETQNQYR